MLKIPDEASSETIMKKKHKFFTVKPTKISQFLMTFKRFIKQPLLIGDSERDMQTTLNTIYEQQMLQLINFLNEEPMRYQELIVINEKSEVINFFGLRKVYKIFN